jgi:predicted amidohydrolase
VAAWSSSSRTTAAGSTCPVSTYTPWPSSSATRLRAVPRRSAATANVPRVQTSPAAQDPRTTFDRFESEVHAVADTFAEVELVMAPELHLSAAGPVLHEPAEYAAEVAIDIPGPETDRLARLALDAGLWLVPGSLYEREGELGLAICCDDRRRRGADRPQHRLQRRPGRLDRALVLLIALY